MTSLTRCALLAGLGIAAMTLPAFAVGSPTLSDSPRFQSKTTQLAVSPYDCFTDDGYGRKRPCSANYKKSKKKKMAK